MSASAYPLGMTRSYAQSAHATVARALVEELQEYFVEGLEELSGAHGGPRKLQRVDWLRDEGRHGGGPRYVSPSNAVFNRAAVNVSGVQSDDDPEIAVNNDPLPLNHAEEFFQRHPYHG